MSLATDLLHGVSDRAHGFKHEGISLDLGRFLTLYPLDLLSIAHLERGCQPLCHLDNLKH
jgi:hypothetical protein